MKSLLSANALGKELGLTGDTILRLYRDEVIDAEIHEGRLIRFDLEKVRSTLAKRAKRNRQSIANCNDMLPLI
jgi:hypothetical protein